MPRTGFSIKLLIFLGAGALLSSLIHFLSTAETPEEQRASKQAVNRFEEMEPGDIVRLSDGRAFWVTSKDSLRINMRRPDQGPLSSIVFVPEFTKEQDHLFTKAQIIKPDNPEYSSLAAEMLSFGRLKKVADAEK